MDATFVIVTRDRWERLAATLRRLRAAYPDAPIVVADNASGSPAPSSVTGVSGVEVLRLAGNLGSAARNAAALRARTPLLALCDDDAWWEPAAIGAAAARLSADPGLAGVVGRVLVEPGGRLDPVSEAHERSGVVTGFLATALVIRRDAFLAGGGFHPRFGIGGEEELLAMRLLSGGWRLAYEPGAVLHHQPAAAEHVTRAGRPVRGVRNRLWTAWLRRPWPVAVRETVAALRENPDPRGVGSALAGLPWVLRERQVNPREVERLYAGSAA